MAREADQANVGWTNPPHLRPRYITIDDMDWERIGPGAERKVLFADPDSGMTTIMFRQAAGSSVPFHEHPELEQTYVLKGRIVDQDGECTAGNYVWRPGGSRHTAHCPEDTIFIAFFMKPSKFMPVPE